ncbi:MAG: TonB family protein [Deltaproteobacteria bacterium]
MGKRRDKGWGAAGIRGPLLGSAAGHLLLLSCLLLAGYAAGPNSPGVVQVALVEGPAKSVPAEEKGLMAAAASASRMNPARQAAKDSRHPGAGASTPFVLPSRLSPVEIPLAAAVAPDAGHGPASTAERPAQPSSVAPAGSLEPSLRDAEHPGRDPAGEGVMPAGRPPAGPAGVVREGAEIRLLRERIESRIVYPEEAIRRGQEGEVLLRIRVGAGGIPREIRVARSSGARALDEAASSGVARAAPLPSTPGWFEVPVRFRLR